MTRIEEIRDIQRPLDEVFDFVSRFETVAEYDPGVRRAKRRTAGEVQVGSRFEVEAIFLGRTLPMEYEILALDRPRSVVLRGVGETAIAEDHIRFEPTASGTRVTWTLDLRLRGPGRLAQPMMGPLFRRLGRKALDGLASHLATSP